MERLQDKRVWLGGGAGVALLIIAIGWFMFISPERSSAGVLRSQAATTRSQNDVLQAKVNALKNKSSQITKYTASLRTAMAELPYDSGLPTFTRQLAAQAKSSAVSLSSVTVGGITSVTPAADAATPSTTATPAPAGNAAAASDNSTGATPVPATANAAGGLFSVQVSIQSNGTLSHQLAFLNAIRVAGPRRALITSTQIGPGTGAKEASIDGAASVTTQLTIFSAPQTPAQITQLNKLLSGKIGN